MFVRRRNKFQETYKSAAAGNVTMVHNHCVEQENGIARVPHAINKNNKVEVTRNECQSVASKNCKAKLKNGTRGNRPDFIC
ncbi:9848_t:CDS:2 [Entrophospora sp. SA101]|nr:9848_t:CDS:2 [Entrophospora sp. SA101]CAJ0908760.1 2281_t:CDS:2 [Entrophospora sp. SA101]